MSSVPTGTSAFEDVRMVRASRSESGIPRRRTPISAKSFAPPVFSTISCAKRSSVRRISSADISCLFSIMRIRAHYPTTMIRVCSFENACGGRALRQFGQQLTKFCCARENLPAVSRFYRRRQALLKFCDFLLEMPSFEGVQAAFGFFPSRFRRIFKKDFKNQGPVLFGKGFGECGCVRTRASLGGFEQRIKNFLRFKTFVEGCLDHLRCQLLAKPIGFGEHLHQATFRRAHGRRH